MSRRFSGYFRGIGAGIHPRLAVAPRPHINVEVSFGRAKGNLPFLIDTGADFTIIQPEHSRRLVRVSGQQPWVSEASDVVPIAGIGSTVEQTSVQTVGLLLVDDEGEKLWFSQSILFADPISSPPWKISSVLGRDVLSRFDLNLSYDPPSVTLALND